MKVFIISFSLSSFKYFEIQTSACNFWLPLLPKSDRCSVKFEVLSIVTPSSSAELVESILSFPRVTVSCS